MQPEVRVVDEAGEVLGFLPLDAPSLNKNDEIVLTNDGETTFKVKMLRYRVQHTVVSSEGAPDTHSLYGRLDYIVEAL